MRGDLMSLASRLNLPGNSGPRLLPLPGEVFTEIEAIRLMTGAEAEMIAAGGIGGAEGAVWLGIKGDDEQMEKTEQLLQRVWLEKQLCL